MRIIVTGLLAFVLFASQGCVLLGLAVYEYTGLNFTNVVDPYTTADRVTGRLTVPELNPNLTFAGIEADVVSYVFNDGHQELNNSNSTVVQIKVSTDANGDIVDARVFVNDASGNIQLVRTTTDFDTGIDNLGPFGANTGAGTWARTQ